MTPRHLVTPFWRQCFVTTGVALNLGGGATVMAFTTGMLPQLRVQGLGMVVDDSIGSWIAATPSICLLFGNLLTPSLMTHLGRKTCNFISVTILILGWIIISLAQNVPAIIFARTMQGISMGMALNLGPILIGEYTSPKNRGAFLMFVSVLTAVGVLMTHAIGAYYNWKYNAFVCMIMSFLNLLVVLYSPESPVWLASKGRFDECKKAFIWLRGDEEIEELEDVIKANVILGRIDGGLDGKMSFVKLKKAGLDLVHNFRRKQFYMPIFIMIHVYAIGQWAGINVLATYTRDVFENIIGSDQNISVHIIALDTQRIISNLAAIYLIQKFKRKTLLSTITSFGILIMLLTAAYSYAKSDNCLPYDHPYIGVILIHLHMFTVASCTISLPYIIAGEIFPLEYKGVAGGISILFFALHFSIVIKSAPFLFTQLGIHGAYLLYAGIVSYSLVVAMIFLPETKDRTLQDIENEFRGIHLKHAESNENVTEKLIDI